MSFLFQEMEVAANYITRNTISMLTEIYIEALLVDEDLADQVWELWVVGEIDDQTAMLAWWSVSTA